ncbi:MAG: glycosyltransferase family 39 protein [Pseudomonadota bacterium]
MENATIEKYPALEKMPSLGAWQQITLSLPPWKIVLLLIAINLFLRASTLFQIAVEIAEPQWAQFAINMIRGEAPYTTMIGEKPFFLYLYYYVVLSLFGTFNLYAVHAVTILWVSCTAAIVFAIVRQFAGREAALSGAIIFSVLTTLGEFKIISSDGETLMNLPMCISALFILVNLKQRKAWMWLASGFFLGIAGQFRYQAGILLPAIGTYFLIYEPIFCSASGERLGRCLTAIGNTLLISLAYAAVYGAVFLYLWQAGSWDSYVFWTLQYEFDYIEVGIKTINVLKKGFTRTSLMILVAFVVWFSAVQTVVHSFKRSEKTPDFLKEFTVFVALWFLWSYAAVCTGGRFYSRYFTQIFPPLAVLAALSFPPQWFEWKKITRWNIAWKRWALIIPALVLWGLRWFSPWIHDAINELDYSPFQAEVGRYISERSAPDETIYIWGWGNSIYFYAKRYPATRFILSDYLTGRVPGSETAYNLNFDTTFNIVEGSWEWFMSDLEKDKPVYILDTSPANIHDYIKYPIDKYPLLKRYIDNNYVKQTTLYGIDIYRRTNR